MQTTTKLCFVISAEWKTKMTGFASSFAHSSSLIAVRIIIMKRKKKSNEHIKTRTHFSFVFAHIFLRQTYLFILIYSVLFIRVYCYHRTSLLLFSQFLITYVDTERIQNVCSIRCEKNIRKKQKTNITNRKPNIHEYNKCS